MAHPDITVDYTSGSSADTTSFSANAPALWIQCYGAGNIVYLDNSPTPVSRTHTVTGSETVPVEMTAFTSTTCSRIRATSRAISPPPFPFPAPTNLAGGAAAISGILPGPNVQDFADAGTIFATTFTPAIGTLSPFNFQATGINITFPAITAAINGQSLGLMNVGTGATANALIPNGIQNVGVPLGNAGTGRTAAAPASQVAIRYTANLTTNSWAPAV